MAKKNQKLAAQGHHVSGNGGANTRENNAGIAEYGERYREWHGVARKVLMAQTLMEQAGGYREAFILMDAVAFAEADLPDEPVRANEQRESEIGEKLREWQNTACLVLTAKRLIELAGGYEEAFLVLDSVFCAINGEQAHEAAAAVRRVASSHCKALAAEAQQAAEEGEQGA